MSDDTNLMRHTMLLRQLVDNTQAILDRLGAEQATPSHVEIKTSTRGVDVSVKAYVGSSVREAGDEAIAEFMRVTEEITARLMGQKAAA